MVPHGEETSWAAAAPRIATKHAHLRMFRKDRDSVYLWCNEHFARSHGRRPEECRQLTDADLLPAELAEASRETDDWVRARGETLEFETSRHANGRLIPCRTVKSPVFGSGGEVTGIFGVSWDVEEADCRCALASTQSSEAHYRGLFDHIDAGVAVYDPVEGGEEFIFKDFNCAAERIDRIDRAQVVGRSVREVFPAVEAFGLLAVFRRVWRTGEPEQFPITYYLDNRVQGWRDNYVYKLPTGEIVAVYQDATEKKRQEEDLRASVERYRTLLETASDAILVFDSPSGTIRDANPAAGALLGRPREQIIGTALQELFPPQDREAHERALLGGGTAHHLEVLRADGLVVPVEVSASLCEVRGHRIVQGIFRDVTAQRKAEREIRRLNQDLERRVADRTRELVAANEELESFAHSISHDLRAPLQVIGGYVDVLIEDYGDVLSEEVRSFLHRVAASSHRMQLLIDDLLRLSRLGREELELEDVHLTALVERVRASLKDREPDRDVSWRIEEGVWVRGDARLLRVALENLLQNAWKFSASRRPAVIEFGTESESEERVCFVRDNGVGFNMEYAGKLFQPFRRLHGEDEFPGTGIGLATAARIIRRHGGRIWAAGTEGEGATFRFTLEPS